jgi:uncharacterized membrane protein
VISFVTIGIMWASHHALFRFIKRVDNPFLFINTLLLMAVTFINFPTHLIAEYSQTPDWNTAAVVYCATGVLIAILFNALWRYASHRNRLLDRATSSEFVQGLSRSYLLGPLLYSGATAVAFFSAPGALLICLGLAIWYALPIERQAR